MQTWTLTSEPTGPSYAELLEAALGRVAELRFVTFDRWDLHDQTELLIESLRPWLIGSQEAQEWPGTQMADGWVGRVHMYRFDAETAATLLRQTTGLSDWGANLPNDPHLLRADGSVWFACITSEDDAWLTLTDEEYREVRMRPSLAGLLPATPDG